MEEFIVPAKVNREECVSCGTCVDECPEEAITLDDEEIATVNPEKCTECGKCVEACPSSAISLDK
jgi:ferredoxin